MLFDSVGFLAVIKVAIAVAERVGSSAEKGNTERTKGSRNGLNSF